MLFLQKWERFYKKAEQKSKIKKHVLQNREYKPQDRSQLPAKSSSFSVAYS